MTVRGFDTYDLTGTMIAPPTPATRPAAPVASTQQARPYLQRLAESRLFNASVILGVFASAVYSIGTVLSLFPLGRVTGVQNMGLWFSVIAGGLAAAGVLTAMLATAVMRVRQ
jgi:hypothetical protein